MKPHPIDPHALAASLHQADPEALSAADLLADIKEYPELYYADHVAASDAKGILPLSVVAWRMTCLIA